MILGAKNTGRNFFEDENKGDERPGFDFKVKEVISANQKRFKFKIWIRELCEEDKFDAIYRSNIYYKIYL